MEFHAWINPYRVKTSLKNQLAPEHIYHQHPEWFVTYGDQLFFDPALPESREFICRVVSDIVSRYDVDAIHMDDYFYPYPVKGLDFPDDESFARYGGGFSNKAYCAPQQCECADKENSSDHPGHQAVGEVRCQSVWYLPQSEE